MDCRGFSNVMGVEIFVDCCYFVLFEVTTRVAGDEGGKSFPCFRKALS
jgi:hypothetical protein